MNASSSSLTCRRYWRGLSFDYGFFVQETARMMSTRAYGAYECLCRDTAGHVFILMERENGWQLKQISYNEALVLVSGSGQQRPAKKFLATYGIADGRKLHRRDPVGLKDKSDKKGGAK